MSADYKVEDGMVVGVVATHKHGSDCEFQICEVAKWEAMTEEEQDEALLEAANESGMFEIYVARSKE